MSPAHVGFIGYGAVARDAHRLLAAHLPAPRLTVLLQPGSPSRAAVPPDVAVVNDMPALLVARPDLVVEAAGPQAVVALVPQALAAGISVLVVSTGAFAEPGLLAGMMAQAWANGTHLLLSAGAIAGLDYVEAAALCEDARLRYTSRKPPAAWRAELAGLGHDASTLANELVLFEGSPDEAARRYPRNLNVALTLKLRFGDGDRMTVRVVADPAVTANTHEIEVESRLGTAVMRFGNVPSADNPKTSALTGHTVAAEIRKVLA